MNNSGSRFDAQGYAILRDVVSTDVCDQLVDAVRREPCAAIGSRRLLDREAFSELARTLRCQPTFAAILPANAVAVQCTLFSKSADSNWSVSPHQDLSIPVVARVEAPGCTGWSRKEDNWFTQPPASVLETLVAVRVQLDPETADSGPLKVIPTSHLQGRLSTAALTRLRTRFPLLPCPVPRGGALVMSPLLVHASAKAKSNVPRRVLHFLFGPPSLPFGLEWATAI